MEERGKIKPLSSKYNMRQIVVPEFKLEIEDGKARLFNLTVQARGKETQQPVKDLRFTLLKDGLELESYHNASGKAVFENVLMGKYKVEISDIKKKVASILLDVNPVRNIKAQA